MTKKINFAVFLLFSLTVFLPGLKAQNMSVKKVQKINEISEGYVACFIPNSSKILFTSVNNNGIKTYNFNTLKIKTLNSDAGAGFEPLISPDGKLVYYKTFQFNAQGKRYSTLISQDIDSKIKKEISSNQRNLSSPKAVSGGVAFIANNSAKAYNTGTSKIKACDQTACFTAPNMDLVLTKNGERKVLNPLGKGNYIWVSLSPKKDKILFNKAGKGTYICDLKGNILAELGRIHAAKWSADGTKIIGMNDFDNGHNYTSSKIVITDEYGKNRNVLKLDKHKIALFPDLSDDNSKIVFNNEKGEVFLIQLN